jgi:serine protease Do
MPAQLRRSGSLFAAAFLMAACPLEAQTRGPISPALRDLDGAIAALTTAVAPSVVQILVTGYRSVDDASRGDVGVVIGRQRSIGSGAIIGADGYIVTNAHVVDGAQQVRVVLHTATAQRPLQALSEDDGLTVPARIVGIAPDIDLALLKVDRTGLRSLPLADYDKVRQGALVFAFGSPDGLRNSVTMGVVSAAARQTDPDSPSVYIQTDAPINPGNSGGPLVNVNGELVGINTFILSQSGGSQGLGFAIPSVVIAAAYPQLKMYGRLHRGVIGVSAQAITPAFAEALGLSRSSGVLVGDVTPGLPAAGAGVQVRDIITSIDDKPVTNVPMLMLALSTRMAGDTVTLSVLRGTNTVRVTMPVVELPHGVDRFGDLSDPIKNGVPQLGIVGTDLDDDVRLLLPALREPSGVLVTARRQELDGESPLRTGDVIHEFNGITVRSLDALRVLADGLKAGSEAVVQVERNQQLMYLTISVY